MTSLSRLGRRHGQCASPLLVTLPAQPGASRRPARPPPPARPAGKPRRDRAATSPSTASNVLRLEVLGREGGWAVDDFLVSGAGLPAALAELEPDVAVLANRGRTSTCSIPGLAMANACATVTAAVSAREAYRQLVGAAIELVFAEAGVRLHPRGAWLPPSARLDRSPACRCSTTAATSLLTLGVLRGRVPDRGRPRAVGARQSSASC